MVERNIDKRIEQERPHHLKSIALFKAIATIDYEFNEDYFCWKCGGDGDNGEKLMYALDIYFECLDAGEEI